jgi:hypothetical protein
LVALLLWSCGPDNDRTCSGQDPNFKVRIELMARPLPADTVVRITYAGSAMEEFRLTDQKAQPEVAFCDKLDQNGAPLAASGSEPAGTAGAPGAGAAAGAGGAAGAAGAAADAPQVVGSISCRLWTAGFTELQISGSGFETVKFKLSPKEGLCTVERDLVVDAPDAGD